MNVVHAQAAGTISRQFEHCDHLMMLVRLPVLTAGNGTWNRTGWCCLVCGQTVDRRTMSIRDREPQKARPGRLELLPGGFRHPRLHNS